MCFESVVRFRQQLLFSSDTIDERARASSLNEGQSFGKALLAGEQTDSQELLVRDQFVSKECRLELFAGERRTQLFSDGDCFSKALFGTFSVALAQRDEPQTGVTTFSD